MEPAPAPPEILISAKEFQQLLDRNHLTVSPTSDDDERSELNDFLVDTVHTLVGHSVMCLSAHPRLSAAADVTPTLAAAVATEALRRTPGANVDFANVAAPPLAELAAQHSDTPLATALRSTKVETKTRKRVREKRRAQRK